MRKFLRVSNIIISNNNIIAMNTHQIHQTHLMNKYKLSRFCTNDKNPYSDVDSEPKFKIQNENESNENKTINISSSKELYLIGWLVNILV